MVRLLSRIGLLFLGATLLLGCGSTSATGSYADDDSKCGVYPPPPEHFVKKTIAIIPFSDKTKQSFTRANLGSMAVDIGTTLLLATGRFNLVERERMDALLAEQKLVGIIDPETAAKAGKALGADLIFTGAITDFEIKKTKTGNRIGLPRIGNMPSISIGKETEILAISMAIDGRVIETETAKVIFADSGEIKREEKAEGYHFGLQGASYTSAGAIELTESAAGKQLRFTLDNIIQKIIPKVDAAYVTTPAQPEPAKENAKTNP